MPISRTAIYGAGDGWSSKRLVHMGSLAISPSLEDCLFLETKLKEAHWKLDVAGGYREALVKLRHTQVPVVLSQSELPDGTWKDVLNLLAPMFHRPRLIVFARHVDNRLRTEVLNLGGFDLLATPFREHELDLLFAIGSAWLDWKGEHERCARSALRQP
jgi:DNA-binding NtrC family response regulator